MVYEIIDCTLAGLLLPSLLVSIPILELTPPASCTYVEPILQSLCFQIHAWNGGCFYPLPDKNGELMNVATLSPNSFDII